MTVLEAYRVIQTLAPQTRTLQNGRQANGRAILRLLKQSYPTADLQAPILAHLADPARSLIEHELLSGRV